MRAVFRVLVGIASLYVIAFVVVLVAMSQTPMRFGRFMRYAPPAIVWGTLPAQKMWLWARGGTLHVGDVAPDFTLPLRDGTRNVTLSSFRRKQPVVLVFGSYT